MLYTHSRPADDVPLSPRAKKLSAFPAPVKEGKVSGVVFSKQAIREIKGSSSLGALADLGDETDQPWPHAVQQLAVLQLTFLDERP